MRATTDKVHNKPKKEKNKMSVAAKLLIITTLIVAAIIFAFLFWVLYGDEADKGKEMRPQEQNQQTEEVQTAVLNVAEDWSVPETAFKGGNGTGKFDPEGVKMTIDEEKLYQEMGVDTASKDETDKMRIETVKRFLDGISYEADPSENISNGDEVTVTITSKEDVKEIEDEAKITIKGVGESKVVTVGGLADKYSVGEFAAQRELIEAAKQAAERQIRASDAGNHRPIFENEEEYNVQLTYYGTYLAKPEDTSSNDAIIVLYRLSSTYPDENYTRWTKNGDYVFTYEMTHFDDVDKTTTVSDITDRLKYDTFRYENQSVEVLDYYRNNLDPNTSYTIQQVG